MRRLCKYYELCQLCSNHNTLLNELMADVKQAKAVVGSF